MKKTKRLRNRRLYISSSVSSINNFIFIILCLFPFILHAQKDKQDLIQKKGENVYVLKDIVIDTDNRTVSFPCTVNMSSGLIEVVLCRPEGKVHESLLTTQVTPLEFQTALLLLGLNPVNEIQENQPESEKRTPYKTSETPGDSVIVFLETEKDGEAVKKRIGNYIYNEQKKSVLEPSTWLFRGAVTMVDDFVVLDPEVSMIVTYHDPVALMELNAGSKYNDELFYVNKNAGLKVKDSVNLIIQSVKK